MRVLGVLVRVGQCQWHITFLVLVREVFISPVYLYVDLPIFSWDQVFWSASSVASKSVKHSYFICVFFIMYSFVFSLLCTQPLNF